MIGDETFYSRQKEKAEKLTARNKKLEAGLNNIIDCCKAKQKKMMVGSLGYNNLKYILTEARTALKK